MPTFLLDAPTLTDAGADSGGPVRTRIPVAKLGDDFKDKRYGKFAITADQAAQWKANLAAQGGQVAIDRDHGADAPGGSTKAAAWITDLQVEGDKVMADVEFTPDGADDVRKKYWRFISPTFVSHYRDERGRDLGDALIGAALTNRPFLRSGMPAINLSTAPDGDLEWQLDADDTSGQPEDEATGQPETEPDADDNCPVCTSKWGKRRKHACDNCGVQPKSATRALAASHDIPTVSEYATIAKALGLDSEADEATIVATARELAADKAKTLDARADAEDKVLLSTQDHDDLKARAEKGDEAVKSLAQRAFDAAYEKAVSEGRVAPAQKDELVALYADSPEHTIKLIDGAQKIVNTEPAGSGGNAPDPVDPDDGDHKSLDDQVQAYLLTMDKPDYATALDKVLAGAKA